MSIIELDRREVPGAARATMMLQRAHWAAEVFARYDIDRVRRILDAVVEPPRRRPRSTRSGPSTRRAWASSSTR